MAVAKVLIASGRLKEMFSDGLNFTSLSQVVGVEESEVFLLGKKT